MGLNPVRNKRFQPLRLEAREGRNKREAIPFPVARKTGKENAPRSREDSRGIEKNHGTFQKEGTCYLQRKSAQATSR
jgi:hypothetical protein